MNGNVSGTGGEDDEGKKKPLSFSPINSDF